MKVVATFPYISLAITLIPLEPGTKLVPENCTVVLVTPVYAIVVDETTGETEGAVAKVKLYRAPF